MFEIEPWTKTWRLERKKDNLARTFLAFEMISNAQKLQGQ